jgi:hypothetical protein
MTEIQNIKPVWVIEKLRFVIYLACDELRPSRNLVLGTWDLINPGLYKWRQRYVERIGHCP